MNNISQADKKSHKSFSCMSRSEKFDYYQSDIDSCNDDLEKPETMSEEEAQAYFNWDYSKDGIRGFIEEELEYAVDAQSEYVESDESEKSEWLGDPGFSSAQDYFHYKYATW